LKLLRFGVLTVPALLTFLVPSKRNVEMTGQQCHWVQTLQRNKSRKMYSVRLSTKATHT